jgi:hypothetical protein
MNKLYVLIFTLLISFSALNASNGPLPVAYKMYPNPLYGNELQIKYDFEFKVGQVYVFTINNIIGQSIYTHILTEDEVKRGIFTIDVEGIKLDKGIYLTKMLNGDHSSVQKLVVR